MPDAIAISSTILCILRSEDHWYWGILTFRREIQPRRSREEGKQSYQDSPARLLPRFCTRYPEEIPVGLEIAEQFQLRPCKRRISHFDRLRPDPVRKNPP